MPMHRRSETREPGTELAGRAEDNLRFIRETMERAGFGNIQSGHGFAPNGKGGYAYFDTVDELGFILEAVEI